MILNKLTLIGALTSKPYAFTARSWELKSIETIDLFDSLNSNIRIDIRGSDVMRVLPITNEFVNEEWISDKTRHAYDAFNRQRFINPMIKTNGFFVSSSWKETFNIIKNKLQKENFAKIIINTGNFVDIESTFLLKQIANNNDKIILNPNNYYDADLQKNYSISNNIFKTKNAQVIIIVGSNLRLENPVLNIRLKKLSNQQNILIGYIGSKVDNTINAIHLGNNLSILNEIISGKHKFCSSIQAFLKKDKSSNFLFKNKIILLFGNDFLKLNNSRKLFNSINQLKMNIFDLQVLEMYTGNINKLELGLFSNVNISNQQKKIHYLINSNKIINHNSDDFVIFQGHHTSINPKYFDVILPTVTWIEKSSIYLNCFGNIQKTQFCVLPPINSRNDWKIIKIIASFININLDFSDLEKVHNKMNDVIPDFENNISVYNTNNQELNFTLLNNTISKINIDLIPFKSHIFNFYQITSIEKASKLMKICVDFFNTKKNNFFKN